MTLNDELASVVDVNEQTVVLPAEIVAGEVPVQQSLRPLSVTDMFRIGIGPSSSHTVGPMRAARHYVHRLAEAMQAAGFFLNPVGSSKLTRLQVHLCGSLGATGRGHSTDVAVILGLEGWKPDEVPTAVVEAAMSRVTGSLHLDRVGYIDFDPARDIVLEPSVILPYHVNGIVLQAEGQLTGGKPFYFESTYYSVGGGFVMVQTGVDETGNVQVESVNSQVTLETYETPAPYPFVTANELIEICSRTGMSIAQVVRANEEAARSRDEVDGYIDSILQAMDECIEAGMNTEGILPGVLAVPRRAAQLHKQITERLSQDDPLRAMDWVNLWALAVNEENAAGHRVVTAPTNGAAGIIPAVLRYHRTFSKNADDDSSRRFILAASAVGALIKTNASIAGAEVGCQGEVGSAAAMAAAGLAEAEGGTPKQVENAAEIAMEHSLGLTCDPVAGLVQIPCIERNAIGAVKAINAARMALWGDGRHQVDLDTVIKTMRQTGEDMNAKYKETSAGGLAVNVVEC